ncbi:MAG: hypothetical protein JKX86_07380 [Verrucomicrobiales bacterium]|nr:hypothetical protein [Verrucomicrobiales bacterium]
MDRIMDVLLPPGSYERREHDLSPEMRGSLDQWRQKQAALIARAEKQHGPEWYALLCDGQLEFPPMPAALRNALGIEDAPTITDQHTEVEAAALWNTICHGDRQ